MKLRRIWKGLGRYRHLWVILFFAVELGWLDANSFRNLQKQEQGMSELRAEIRKYRTLYDNDRALLDGLQNNPKAIEHVARERYLMHAADEDVYIFEDNEDTD